MTSSSKEPSRRPCLSSRRRRWPRQRRASSLRPPAFSEDHVGEAGALAAVGVVERHPQRAQRQPRALRRRGPALADRNRLCAGHEAPGGAVESAFDEGQAREGAPAPPARRRQSRPRRGPRDAPTWPPKSACRRATCSRCVRPSDAAAATPRTWKRHRSPRAAPAPAATFAPRNADRAARARRSAAAGSCRMRPCPPRCRLDRREPRMARTARQEIAEAMARPLSAAYGRTHGCVPTERSGLTACSTRMAALALSSVRRTALASLGLNAFPEALIRPSARWHGSCSSA